MAPPSYRASGSNIERGESPRDIVTISEPRTNSLLARKAFRWIRHRDEPFPVTLRGHGTIVPGLGRFSGSRNSTRFRKRMVDSEDRRSNRKIPRFDPCQVPDDQPPLRKHFEQMALLA